MLRQRLVLFCTLSSACGGFLGAFLAGAHMHLSPLWQIITGISGGMGGGTGGIIAGRRIQRRYAKDD
jgi:hypothetical protein